MVFSSDPAGWPRCGEHGSMKQPLDLASAARCRRTFLTWSTAPLLWGAGSLFAFHAARASAEAGCAPLLQHTFKRLQDEKPQPLCHYSGKVLLVVNTASYCGFTGQFEGLEALNAKYASRGLVVLGFPSNDFKQEDADARKTAEVCFNTYGVKFPMFTEPRVKGRDAHPLFAELARATGSQPSWNFNKYLVGRDGKPLAHFGSMTSPDNRKFVAAIEAALSGR